MTPHSWITDGLRKASGQIISEQTSFPISSSDIRKWAQAVYYPDSPPARYWDEDNEQVVLSGGLIFQSSPVIINNMAR